MSKYGGLKKLSYKTELKTDLRVVTSYFELLTRINLKDETFSSY